MSLLRRLLRADVVVLAVLLIYPFLPFLDLAVDAATGKPLQLDRKLVSIFIFAILALALNLQVGYAGLLQLGIAAFFAIGAYSTGVLSVQKYPFQIGFVGTLVAAPVVAGLAGLALGAPTIRLRGDYLAIVTLGFGEVVRVTILNLEGITDGPRGLNPIPPPDLPAGLAHALGADADPGRASFLALYYASLVLLALLVVGFRALERSRLGRAFAALREDELACACTGVSPARTKLAAFAAGGALAGLAGALYATNLTTTAEPNTYDFAISVIVLCYVILGGLGSVPGAILGTFVLYTFDSVVAPRLTEALQGAQGTGTNVLLTFTNWRLLIFGVVLVLVMRFRPEGLLPSARLRAELHHEDAEASGAPAAPSPAAPRKGPDAPP